MRSAIWRTADAKPLGKTSAQYTQRTTSAISRQRRPCLLESEKPLWSPQEWARVAFCDTKNNTWPTAVSAPDTRPDVRVTPPVPFRVMSRAV
ncbi:hypothetical protein EMIT0P44_40138 [Pseudomonas sp. IT-P44]